MKTLFWIWFLISLNGQIHFMIFDTGTNADHNDFFNPLQCR